MYNLNKILEVNTHSHHLRQESAGSVSAAPCAFLNHIPFSPRRSLFYLGDNSSVYNLTYMNTFLKRYTLFWTCMESCWWHPSRICFCCSTLCLWYSPTFWLPILSFSLMRRILFFESTWNTMVEFSLSMLTIRLISIFFGYYSAAMCNLANAS